MLADSRAPSAVVADARGCVAPKIVWLLPSTRTRTIAAEAEPTIASTSPQTTGSMRVRRSTNPPSTRGSDRRAAGLLTRGSLLHRLPSVSQWHGGGAASPLTAAGPSRTCTGFPDPPAYVRAEPTIAS